MIYQSVPDTEPLRQGDILFPIPMVEPPDLKGIELLNSGEDASVEWSEQVYTNSENIIAVRMIPVCGIIATQDCDASRAPEISCFYVGPFEEVTKLGFGNSLKKKVDLIVKQTQIANKWFYLPEDPAFKLIQPMAANFLRVFQIDRESLESKKSELRVGRLNDVAYEHYRESIAQHFRRYPFNPWYPLTPKGFECYKAGVAAGNPVEGDKIECYEWQKDNNSTN